MVSNILKKWIYETIRKDILPDIEKLNSRNFRSECSWFNCANEAIKSHSQTKSFIQNLTTTQHVYHFLPNIMVQENNPIKRIGVNDASVFKGFCAQHDSSRFNLIENKNLEKIDNEQAFLFLIRTIAFEFSVKELILTKQRIFLTKLKGHPTLPVKYNRIYMDFLEQNVKGKELFLKRDYPRIFKELNAIWQEKDYSTVHSLTLCFDKIPVYLSTIVNPLFDDYDGFPDTQHAQPMLALNIIPYPKHSLLVMSWLQSDDEYMTRILSYFKPGFSIQYVIKFINILIFLESENYSLAPDFWEGLTEHQKD